MKKQTAIDWLVKEFNLEEYEATIKLAKSMEKEQIIESWEHGDKHEPWIIGRKTGEQYYNETYGN